MELDVSALQVLVEAEADAEVGLWPCTVTCTITCGGLTL
jgi:hypothetical protein